MTVLLKALQMRSVAICHAYHLFKHKYSMLSFQVIIKKLAKPLELIANILDRSLKVLKSNILMDETNDTAGGGIAVSASGPAWNFKSIFYSATLAAYFVVFALAVIVASGDAIISGSKKAKGKKTRQAPFHALNFFFRKPIIFCALGIIIATSKVWAHNHQVCVCVF